MRAIALQLAREGVDLFLLDIHQADLVDVVAAVKRERPKYRVPPVGR